MSFRRGFLAPSLFLLAAATPAAAQVRVGVHIDIPILGGHAPVIVRRPAPPPPPRVIVVSDYSARRYGRWEKDARKWDVVTLWWYDGRYYEREVPRARRVVVYRYRDEYFRDPQDRDWYAYRDRYIRQHDDQRGAWWDNDRRDWRDDDRRSDDRGDYRRDDDGRGNARGDDHRDDRRPEPPKPPQRDDDRRARPRG